MLSVFDSFLGPQIDIGPDGIVAFVLHRGTASARRCGARFGENADTSPLHMLNPADGSHRSIPAPKGWGLFSPLWSWNGRWIALAATDGQGIRPFIFDVVSGAFRSLAERSLALDGTRPFRWSPDDLLVCRLLPEGNTPFYIDSELRAPARAMAAWQMAWTSSAATASVMNGSDLRAMEAPGEACEIDPLSGHLRFAMHAGAGSDDASNQDGLLCKPSSPAEALQDAPVYSQEVTRNCIGDLAIYLSRDDDGTRLWTAGVHGTELLFETDQHLAEITPSRFLTVQFERSDGTQASARCILPPDYCAGEARPAVMWVYPGTTIGDRPSPEQRLNYSGFFNLQLLAAQGYVVIVPEIPDHETWAGRDLVDGLVDAVRSALEAVASDGLIDRARVQLFGQSMGGWAVLTLLAETAFFRSGIAMASISNLISAHGQFDPRCRYDATVHEHLSGRRMIEECWHLPGAPSRHLARYVRNSPVFSVERISAPILLLHGDQDPVPMAQAEEMFSALRGAGKTVQLVRYWGEGHILSSPANVRDAWRRIVEWLDLHSLPAS